MSKYKHVPTVIDGIRFDSKKEAARWQELKLWEKSGEIRELRHHARWPIEIKGKKVCDYVCDFDYYWRNDKASTSHDIQWDCIIEDVKSPVTRKLPTYRLKRKLMDAYYGIEIKEL